GRQVQEGGRAGPGVELERLQVPAGDKRTIHERRERHGLEGDDAALVLFRVRLQRGRIFPRVGQPQAKLYRLVVRRRALRVDETGVPVDDADVARTGGGGAGRVWARWFPDGGPIPPPPARSPVHRGQPATA